MIAFFVMHKLQIYQFRLLVTLMFNSMVLSLSIIERVLETYRLLPAVQSQHKVLNFMIVTAMLVLREFIRHTAI